MHPVVECDEIRLAPPPCYLSRPILRSPVLLGDVRYEECRANGGDQGATELFQVWSVKIDGFDLRSSSHGHVGQGGYSRLLRDGPAAGVVTIEVGYLTMPPRRS